MIKTFTLYALSKRYVKHFIKLIFALKKNFWIWFILTFVISLYFVIIITINTSSLFLIIMLKVIDETLDWLLLAIKSILWTCVVKTRVIFLARQIFLINQKHISTLLYARNITRKNNKWKIHPFTLLSLSFEINVG